MSNFTDTTSTILARKEHYFPYFLFTVASLNFLLILGISVWFAVRYIRRVVPKSICLLRNRWREVRSKRSRTSAGLGVGGYVALEEGGVINESIHGYDDPAGAVDEVEMMLLRHHSGQVIEAGSLRLLAKVEDMDVTEARAGL